MGCPDRKTPCQDKSFGGSLPGCVSLSVVVCESRIHSSTRRAYVNPACETSAALNRICLYGTSSCSENKNLGLHACPRRGKSNADTRVRAAQPKAVKQFTEGPRQHCELGAACCPSALFVQATVVEPDKALAWTPEACSACGQRNERGTTWGAVVGLKEGQLQVLVVAAPTLPARPLKRWAR